MFENVLDRSISRLKGKMMRAITTGRDIVTWTNMTQGLRSFV